MIKTGSCNKGTYGIVYSAKMDKKDKTEVAVKRNIIDADITFSGSIKELDLLNRLRSHPYIVRLISISFGTPFSCINSPIPDNKRGHYRDDYLHFIFENANQNLHSLIYEKTVHVAYLKQCLVQILLAVEYMHAKGVIHRDIKPANLLWFVENNKTSVKLCDFGLSKIHTDQAPSSPGVVTCWYRAPEICCSNSNYSYPSDMWSVGCVFYEMIAKNALLVGYKDDNTKILSKIIGLSPSATPRDLIKLTKNKMTLTKEASPKYKKTWRQMINLSEEDIEEFNKYPGVSSNEKEEKKEIEANYDDFLDLLDKIMQVNPKNRLTATEALSHNFFKPYTNIIEWSRTNFPPVSKVETPITIIDCIERKWIIQSAFKFFNKRAELKWFKYRILFQSIDMFDRYLVYCESLDSVTHKIPSDHNGKYMTKENSNLKYMVCLYMCIKYFTTLSVPISYMELVENIYKTPKALLEAEEYEQKMLRDILKFKIYRETIYEAADKLSSGEVNPKETKLDDHKLRDITEQYGKIGNKENISAIDLLKEIIVIIEKK